MDSQKRRVSARRVARWLVGLGVLYAMLRWFEHSQIYHPSREFDASPEELHRPFEEARFKAADGVALHGWFFPANTNSPRETSGPATQIAHRTSISRGEPRAQLVFLICHGNAGNVSHRLGLCGGLLETGASVLVFDYRGYGRSEGRPGEEGTYRDAQAAYAWLRQKGFRGEQIVAFGESLGGGVVSELALRETLGGVVLQSTFTSMPEIGAELFPWLPVRLLSTIKYDTRAKLPRIRVPVLVMHSRADDLAGFHHGERNIAAANEPKFFCELNGGHNAAAWESPAFGEAIQNLLRLVAERARP